MVQALVICEFKANQGYRVRPCLTTSLVSKAANLSVPTISGHRSHPPHFYRWRNKVWEVSLSKVIISKTAAYKTLTLEADVKKYMTVFFLSMESWDTHTHTVKKV